MSQIHPLGDAFTYHHVIPVNGSAWVGLRVPTYFEIFLIKSVVEKILCSVWSLGGMEPSIRWASHITHKLPKLSSKFSHPSFATPCGMQRINPFRPPTEVTLRNIPYLFLKIFSRSFSLAPLWIKLSRVSSIALQMTYCSQDVPANSTVLEFWSAGFVQ